MLHESALKFPSEAFLRFQRTERLIICFSGRKQLNTWGKCITIKAALIFVSETQQIEKSLKIRHPSQRPKSSLHFW